MTLWDRRRNVDIFKFEETGELPVEEQLRQKWLQWFGHLKRMPNHWLQKPVLRCQPCGKKRKPGGTLQHWPWIDIIHRDLSKIPNWDVLVKGRLQWRSIIHQLHLPASSMTIDN